MPSRPICATPVDLGDLATCPSGMSCPSREPTGRPRAFSAGLGRAAEDPQVEAPRALEDEAHGAPMVASHRGEGVFGGDAVARQARSRSTRTLSIGSPSARSTRTSPAPGMLAQDLADAARCRSWSAGRRPRGRTTTSAREPEIISLVLSSMGCEIETKVDGTSRSIAS
jgi:hypothetical protein